MQAIDHWETHYADSPRFTLQRFVADICKQHNLREQRSDILLSLVQSMNMPSGSLLADPRSDQPAATSTSATAMAQSFCLLMATLLDSVPVSQRHSVRLDLHSSLDQRKLPPSVSSAMQAWLGNDRPLSLTNAPSPVLRALLNRTYVVLCERLGPVEADRLLAGAVNRSQSERPDLGNSLADLL